MKIPRNKNLPLRVTEAEKEHWKKLANDHGMKSLSHLIRRAIQLFEIHGKGE